MECIWNKKNGECRCICFDSHRITKCFSLFHIFQTPLLTHISRSTRTTNPPTYPQRFVIFAGISPVCCTSSSSVILIQNTSTLISMWNVKSRTTASAARYAAANYLHEDEMNKCVGKVCRWCVLSAKRALSVFCSAYSVIPRIRRLVRIYIQSKLFQFIIIIIN